MQESALLNKYNVLKKYSDAGTTRLAIRGLDFAYFPGMHDQTKGIYYSFLNIYPGNPKMKKRASFGFIIGPLLIHPPLHAATWTADFQNTVATDQVYLFLTVPGSGNVRFDGWAAAPHRDAVIWWIFELAPAITWDIDRQTPDLLSASGGTFGTQLIWDFRGLFSLQLSNDSAAPTDFSLEYAFLLDGALADVGTGTWNAGTATWTWTKDFTSTIPNPIGGTAWLLASGLLVAAGIRRAKRPSAP
jgi:hypothetical protein